MSVLIYARWNPPVDNNLADLEGARQDLLDAREFCLRYMKASLTSPNDYAILDALATAILVRYARSFTTGVRESLKARVEEALDRAKREKHHRVLAIRDKHVAHPVNMFETNDINVGFCSDDLPDTRATVVSTSTRTSVSLSLKDASDIKTLCETWLEYVRRLMEDEQERLLIHAQKLTASELLDLPRGSVEPDDDPMKKRKSRT